jgi:hypothetical protein
VIPAAAVKAGVKAIQDAQTPEVWRSWEALVEAVLTAAVPHLTVEVLIPDADLFGGVS